MRLLGFEAHGGVFVPEMFRNPVGQLRMDAPYTHRDFVRPAGPIATPEKVQEGPRELLVKKRGVFTRYAPEHPPMDVVGWDGFVYPFAFAIEKYQPKTGLVHLPPTIHATFEGRGFLVCSFVPRVTDTHPQAIPCPYPHSSVDCDEVILYLRGNFTSRRGVGPGAISLHPAGIAHGPHPGAYEASIGTKRTDELAVMCDTYEPLTPDGAGREPRGRRATTTRGRRRPEASRLRALAAHFRLASPSQRPSALGTNARARTLVTATWSSIQSGIQCSWSRSRASTRA